VFIANKLPTTNKKVGPEMPLKLADRQIKSGDTITKFEKEINASQIKLCTNSNKQTEVLLSLSV
jgi:hypothetical protein